MRGVAHDPVLRAKLMAQHEAGIPLSVLSERHGIARPVLSRWWQRYQAADLGGLQPRSRRPHRSPTQYGPDVAAVIDTVRDFGWGVGRIAHELGLGHGTVQRALERSGRQRRPPVPRRPVQRYEKTRPGELLHLDYKYLPQLGNRAEFEYVAIDDFSREAVARIAGRAEHGRGDGVPRARADAVTVSRRGRDDRQRHVVYDALRVLFRTAHAVPAGAPECRDRPPVDSAAYAGVQWQGRALDQDD